MQGHAHSCQAELHRWGKANQVSFDANKESVHVISHTQPHGDNFKILGVMFDCQLRMGAAVEDLVNAVTWKCLTILRSRRFHNQASILQVYKAKVLSFIEYRTPALFHATATVLRKLDATQDRFLREIGVSKEDALSYFHLAPLNSRRDMAMMGLIHRTVLCQGPVHFQEVFERAPPSADQKHARQLKTLRNARHLKAIARSALGLADVYNLLPEDIAMRPSVKMLQHEMQALLKHRATRGEDAWDSTFSTRHDLCLHPLLNFA